MNKRIGFSQFRNLCISNSSRKYVLQLLDIISDQDCIFNPGIIAPREQTASLYRLRLNVQKDHGYTGKEYLGDYEDTVTAIENSSSAETGICWLSADQAGYVVFFEPEENKILGILNYQKSENLDLSGTNIDDSILQGHSSAAEKYSKGMRVKNDSD
ncbi:MAG: hypothetical protein QM781_19215 [Chitinophagaceae bacterium]